jgi:hypothetical protein
VARPPEQTSRDLGLVPLLRGLYGIQEQGGFNVVSKLGLGDGDVVITGDSSCGPCLHGRGKPNTFHFDNMQTRRHHGLYF